VSVNVVGEQINVTLLLKRIVLQARPSVRLSAVEGT